MIVQLIANSLITAAEISLIAVGFSILFAVRRFFHFVPGAIFAVGAYLALFFQTTFATFFFGVTGCRFM